MRFVQQFVLLKNSGTFLIYGFGIWIVKYAKPQGSLGTKLSFGKTSRAATLSDLPTNKYSVSICALQGTGCFGPQQEVTESQFIAAIIYTDHLLSNAGKFIGLDQYQLFQEILLND